MIMAARLLALLALIPTAALSAPLTTREFCAAIEAPGGACTGDGLASSKHQCLELLNSALAAKSVRMNTAEAQECAYKRTPEACAGVFVGTVKKGARCESALDCVEGLVCVGKTGGAPGACTEPLALGATCSSEPVNGSSIARLAAGLRPVCGKGAHCATSGAAICVKGDSAACGAK